MNESAHAVDPVRGYLIWPSYLSTFVPPVVLVVAVVDPCFFFFPARQRERGEKKTSCEQRRDARWAEPGAGFISCCPVPLVGTEVRAGVARARPRRESRSPGKSRDPVGF